MSIILIPNFLLLIKQATRKTEKSLFAFGAWLLPVAVLFFSEPLYAQIPDYRIQKVDLPITGNIEAFEMDSLGQLWIGTTNGHALFKQWKKCKNG